MLLITPKRGSPAYESGGAKGKDIWLKRKGENKGSSRAWRAKYVRQVGNISNAASTL